MYVYFIRYGHGYTVKIGKSNSPLSRLTQLQTANPNKLELFGAILCASEADSLRVEREMHDFHAQHAPQRVGEWFTFSWTAMQWLNGYLIRNNAKYPECFNGSLADPRKQAQKQVIEESMQINKWVRLKKLCELTGETDDGVRSSISGGMWPEGLMWRKAPNGRIYVNVENYNRWIEGKPLAADAEMPSRETE